DVSDVDVLDLAVFGSILLVNSTAELWCEQRLRICDPKTFSAGVHPRLGTMHTNRDAGISSFSEALNCGPEDTGLPGHLSASLPSVLGPDSLYVSVPGADAESSNVVGRESGHPGSHETFVTVERLQRPLCGGSRPHFFRGVCTVVTKLFHICEPDVAVFGRKDYQQWRVICRMVRDLDFPVEVVGMPICREPDGLAMSSHNARLSPESGERALCISRGLACAEKAVAEEAASEPADVAAQLRGRIEEGGGTVDYVEWRLVLINDAALIAAMAGRRHCRIEQFDQAHPIRPFNDKI
ncbi:hypothetical protein VOLCADRAFT_93630, partial [Volvox carteri f. nagariensis]